MYDVILKKRQGGELSSDEIKFFVNGFVGGDIPDYQVSALLMAICLKGMNRRETADLTRHMYLSGEVADLSALPGIKVDKHSTGGVGDKTTLIVGPMIAAAGVPFAKMSGRGLGHTGGTIDKLESIPGFRTTLTNDEFIAQVKKTGIAVSSQSKNMVPADKKLYALRDVTATVDSIPLIASSIMSKKLAAGANAILLDIKVGMGAFMKTVDEALALAHVMIEIGHSLGRKTVALLTGMDQPLGNAVGNALEIKEVISTLKGEGPEDLAGLCLALGSELLLMSGKASNMDEAACELEKHLRSGAALEKFKEMVQAQGGDPGVTENTGMLPGTSGKTIIISEKSGYVQVLDASLIGSASMLIGAGRQTRDSSLDPGAGIKLYKKRGDLAQKGEPVAALYYNFGARHDEAVKLAAAAYRIGEEKPLSPPLIINRIG